MSAGDVHETPAADMNPLSSPRFAAMAPSVVSASEQSDIEAALERDGILEDSWTQRQGSRPSEDATDIHQEASTSSQSLSRRLRKSHSMFPLRLPATELPERPRRPSMIQKGLQMFMPCRRVAVPSQPDGESSRTSERRRPSFLQRVGNVAHGRHPSLGTAANSKTEAVTIEPTDVFPYGSHFDSSSCILNPGGGAAARAAAAAQNEKTLEACRAYQQRDSNKIGEIHVPGDSESGICIDLRVPVEDSEPHNRRDPAVVLPEEIFAHILSFCGVEALKLAEQISRRWHQTASSDHTWKGAFLDAYAPASADDTTAFVTRIGGRGLGTGARHQQWKKMCRARSRLEDKWNRAEAAAIYLEGHDDSVYCAQFDEKKIITGSRDRTLRVWDTHTLECIRIIGVPKERNTSPQPEPLASRGGHKPTRIIVPGFIPPDAHSRDRQIEPLYHTGSILCLQYDDDIMITGSSDNTCIVWDMRNDYMPLRCLRRHTLGVLDICFDATQIVTCSKDTTICIWDRESGAHLRTLTGHRGPVNAVQMRGSLVISASGDGIAKLWNLGTGTCVREFQSRDRGLACVEFRADSRMVLAGGNDKVVYQFDAQNGNLVQEYKGHKGLVRSLHLDGANGRVVSGSYDTSVKTYRLDGRLLCDFAGWTTSWMLSAKADYRRIVATSQDSRTVIMDFGYGLEDVELLEG